MPFPERRLLRSLFQRGRAARRRNGAPTPPAIVGTLEVRRLLSQTQPLTAAWSATTVEVGESLHVRWSAGDTPQVAELAIRPSGGSWQSIGEPTATTSHRLATATLSPGPYEARLTLGPPDQPATHESRHLFTVAAAAGHLQLVDLPPGEVPTIERGQPLPLGARIAGVRSAYESTVQVRPLTGP